MQEYRNRFLERLVAQDVGGSMEVIETALTAGIPADKILLMIVSSAMDEIGQRQANQEITLSEVFVTANIGEMAIERLLTQMPQRPVPVGTVVIGTIQGDYHSMGRKIVSSFLRVASFRVIDLGSNVVPSRFVDTAVAEHASVICASALLLHTAENIKEIRRLIDERNLNRWVKLVVGGAAFNLDRQLYRTVGADATAPNALGAVACVRILSRGAGQ